ncbi:MAG: L,D-transpeptidase family protein [Ilumatobacteraceae bacterium]
MVQPLAPLKIPDPNAARRRLIVVSVLVVTFVVGLVAWSLRGTFPEAVVDTTSTSQVEEDTTTTTVAEATITDTACTISEFEISLGDIGESVRCAQIALVAAGYSNVEITGVFDEETDEATREFQTDLELYVDGIISKVTATELGVWPGLEAFIVRTPAPAPGAVDLIGMPLSPVASTGSDAPELPEDAGQGTGKRVVYQRSSQRVWAIDDDEQIVRSYLVSGSRYRNEVPGWHKVYSRSESALGWDLQADLPYMIRYTQTERGHIGFHAIPSWRDSDEKLQTIDELGQRLSGGCTRQAPQDAEFLWSFADVGTRVLVL